MSDLGKHWCIIPARGGSKALPRKNISELHGRPLISYVINAALKAEKIDLVVVTTDDEEIRKISIEYGAEAPFFRPKELARDDSPTLPAIQHAVRSLEQLHGSSPETVTLLQPTSPFTRSEQIDEAVRLLKNTRDADAVTTVVELDHVNHPFNVRKMDERGFVDFFMPEEHYRYPNRQLKPTFYRFGNLYVTRRKTLIEDGSLYGERCLPLFVDPVSCYDVNDARDLAIANCLIQCGLRGLTVNGPLPGRA